MRGRVVGRPDLTSAWAKLYWGDRCRDIFGEELRIWGDPDLDTAISVDWQDHPDHALVCLTRVSPTSADWPLMIGDVLSDYRAALNYAAYEMVLSGAKPSSCDHPRMQFPIVETAKHPTAHGFPEYVRTSGNLPGVAAKYIRAISPFQPYWTRRKTRWPLDALRALSNRDKHRKPVLAPRVVNASYLSQSPRVAASGQVMVPITLKWLPGWQTPHPGAKLVRLNGAPGFHPVRGRNSQTFTGNDSAVGVDLQFRTSVAFQDYCSKEVLNTLTRISDTVRQILEAIERV